MEILKNYYPNLSETQISQFEALYDLYKEWNEKINVISRKDIENLYLHHVLHSLGIEKIVQFKKTTSVLDVGTGGGFPGIPLAILFPDVSFLLIDSIAKKLKVVQAVTEEIQLKNVQTRHCRIQEEKGLYDFIVSRAVMPLDEMVKLVKKNIKKEQKNSIPNGLICLKGGDLQNEIAPFNKQVISIELKNHFKEPFFETKKIIYLPL